MQCIAISGKFCSGKDSLANELIALDERYRRISLADALKQDICDLCCVPLATLNANKHIYRGLLQAYGVVMRDVWGDDYWVDRLFDDARAAGNEHLIIADVRFPSEVLGIKGFLGEENTHLIRLTAPIEVLVERYKEIYGTEPTEEQLRHSSETALDDYVAPGVSFHQYLRSDLGSPKLLARIVADTLASKGFDFGPAPVVQEAVVLEAYKGTDGGQDADSAAA